MRMAVDLGRASRGLRIITVEIDLVLERFEELRVEHACDRAAVELADQRLNKRMREILESIDEMVGIASVEPAQRDVSAVMKAGSVSERDSHRAASV
jgi:hypothetical protein